MPGRPKEDFSTSHEMSEKEVARDDSWCLLTCGEGPRDDFWKEAEALYADGLFCDLHLLCADGIHVPCHRMVMAAVSPVMAR